MQRLKLKSFMKILFLILILIKHIVSQNIISSIKCRSEPYNGVNKIEGYNPKINYNNQNIYVLVNLNFYYIFDKEEHSQQQLINACQKQVQNLNDAYNKPGYTSNIYFNFYDITYHKR